MAKKGSGQSPNQNLSFNQRKVLAEFCANFAVAWLAAGVIAPYIAREKLTFATRSTFFSIFIAGVLITFMLSLVKEDEK